MTTEKGFTLIEVIASILLLSLILLSFITIYTNTYKTANKNIEKTVMINLADSQLKRLQNTLSSEQITEIRKNIQSSNNPVLSDTQIEMNNKKYQVEFKCTQDQDEFSKKLINVVVTVIYGSSSSKVEGYLKYED